MSGRGSLQAALGRPVNYGQLVVDAFARAQAVYHRHADAVVGAVTVDQDPGAELAGRASAVVDSSGPRGVVTDVTYPLSRPQRDPDTFMSRAALDALRLVPTP